MRNGFKHNPKTTSQFWNTKGCGNRRRYFQEVKYAKEYIIRCTNASGHILREIYLDDEDPEVINIQKYNLTNITELKEPGNYIIKVKVLSNNIYQDSKWSEETTYVNYGWNELSIWYFLRFQSKIGYFFKRLKMILDLCSI